MARNGYWKPSVEVQEHGFRGKPSLFVVQTRSSLWPHPPWKGMFLKAEGYGHRDVAHWI